MPSNLLHTTNTFLQEDVIHASHMGLFSPRALTVDSSKIQLDADNRKIVRPGTVLYKIAGQDLGRVGIRTKLESAIAATTTTVVSLIQQGAIYQSETAQYFADGDELKVLRPYGTVAISGVLAADDTLTATINSHSVTYTLTADDVAGDAAADLVAAAAGLAAAINADPIASRLVEAISDGVDTVYIFSKSLKPYSLAASEATAGTGAATASGTELAGNVTIGTIDASGVSVANGTVTLAAAAAVTLPAGSPIGVEGMPWGLVLGAYDATKADDDVTGFSSGPIYGDRLPYWDDDIADSLQMTFV